MTGESHAEKTAYLCLRDDFRTQFQWKRDRLTRDEFREWARSRRNPPIHVGPHKWRPMRDGEPVPRAMVEAFSEYISDVLHLGRYPVSAIASPCGDELTPQSQTAAREPYAWNLGWAELLAVIARNFSVPEEAYCQNETDLAQAALMVVRWVGEQTDASVTGKPAIALATGGNKKSPPKRISGQISAVSHQPAEKNEPNVIPHLPHERTELS